MQSTHKYTVKSDSYSIGKLTEWMKIGDMDNIDEDIFKSPETCRYFALKLGQLTEEDPANRPTCSEVANLVMGPPWNMTPPEFVFRKSPL
jgi:hypothetical protein